MTPWAAWSITALGTGDRCSACRSAQADAEGRVRPDRHSVAGVRDRGPRVAHRPVLALCRRRRHVDVPALRLSDLPAGLLAAGRRADVLVPAVLPLDRRRAAHDLRRFEHGRVLVGCDLPDGVGAVRASSGRGRVRISLGAGRGGAVPDDRDAGTGVDVRRHRAVGHRVGRLHLSRGAGDRCRRGFAARSRSRTAIGAGVLASIGFYTRLNNLPMAFASSAFGLSLAVPSRGWWRPKTWWPHVSWNALFGVAGVILTAMMLFTLRTYHYTGVFSMLHGTTWGNHVLWRPGQPLSEAAAGMFSSLMMVLTFNDPPRFAIYALPLLFGAVVAVAAMAEHQGVSRRAAGAGGVFPGGVFRGAGGARRRLCRPVLGAPARRRLRADGVRDRVAGRDASSTQPGDRGSSRSSDPARE